MADLIDKALGAADKAVTENGDEWVHKALDGADKIAADYSDGMFAPVIKNGTAALRKHETDIARWGKWATLTALAAFGAGQPAEKALEALRTSATFAERLQAQEAATDELNRQTEERKAAEAAFKATLEELGRVAVRAIVPFLLTALAAL